MGSTNATKRRTRSTNTGRTISSRPSIGAWGVDLAPDPRAIYTFVRPKSGGRNPGVVVTDPRGRVWRVKQASRGDQAAAASRGNSITRNGGRSGYVRCSNGLATL